MNKQDYYRNAEIHKVLSNPKRLEILHLLNGTEMTVNEIAQALKVKLPNVSQHLTVMRGMKLVKARKDGQKTYYKLTNAKIVEPGKIFKELFESGAFNKEYFSTE